MLSAKTTIPSGFRAGLVALVLSVGLAATQAFSGAPPSPWVDADLNGPGVAGSVTWVAAGGINATDLFTITGGGGDIWGGTDQANFCYQTVTGDFTIQCRLTASPTGTSGDAWRKYGVWACQSLTTNNPSFMSDASGDIGNSGGQINCQWDGDSWQQGQNIVFPVWVRITRAGNVFTGYSASDNAGTPGAWNQITQQTITMNAALYVGLFSCAHNNGQYSTMTFDSVSGTNIIWTYNQLSPPTFSLGATPGTITFGAADANATIFYTIDGTTPAEVGGVPQGTTQSAIVGGSTVGTLTAQVPVKAFAYDAASGLADSAIVTGTLASPTFSGGGNLPTSVTLNAAVGTTIYYTTDGSTPTPGSANVPTGSPVAIAGQQIQMRAMAALPGWSNSPVATSNWYSEPLCTAPMISPGVGGIIPPGGQTVTLADTQTQGTDASPLRIYYTTDGSTPNGDLAGNPSGTSLLYTAPFVVNNANTLVQAVAVAFGYLNSNWNANGVTGSQPWSFFDTLRTPEFAPSANMSALGFANGVYEQYYEHGGLLPDGTSDLNAGGWTPVATTPVGYVTPAIYANCTIVQNGANPYNPAHGDQWGIQFTGYITVNQNGMYTFGTTADDGARIYIGNRLADDNNYWQGQGNGQLDVDVNWAYTGQNHNNVKQIGLAAGTHKITVQFYEGGGGWGLSADYAGPGLSGTVYYTNNRGTAFYSMPQTALWTEPIPTLSSLDVIGGPTAGGTLVHITGTGFVVTSAVTFGGTPATNVTINSNTSITCRAPAHVAGAAGVIIKNPNDAVSGSLNYTYVDWTGLLTPAPTSLDLTSGPQAGGTLIDITGTGFATGAGTSVDVWFGANKSTYVKVNSNTLIQCKSPAGAALGGVDVTVVNTYTGTGSASGTLSSGFAYVDWTGKLIPTVTSIDVTGGPLTGGTLVNITGTNFAAGAKVNFGLNLAGYLTVVSDTKIQCKSPPGTGTVDVTVTDLYGGTSGASGTATSQFTYVDWTVQPRSTPIFDTVAPATSTQTGGVPVTISDSAFNGSFADFQPDSATVYFGVVKATNLAVFDEDTITCTAPPSGAIGLVDVTVTGLYGTQGASTTKTGAFTYTAALPPTLAGLHTTSSGASPLVTHGLSGTTVWLHGTNFLPPPGLTVDFGTVPATGVNYTSGTRVTAVIPPMVPGPATVDVSITTSAGGPATLSAYFTYDTPTINVNGIVPSTGGSYGGTVVTITGTNFGVGVSVTFGGTAATNVTRTSATQITATTPAKPGTSGPVDVVVTNPGGLQATAAGGFTYHGPLITGFTGTCPYTGGTPIQINGNNFGAGAAVTFGGVAGTSVSVNTNGTIITVTPPAMVSVATVTVVVTNPAPDGLSGNAQFTYSGLIPADLPSTAGLFPGVFRQYYEQGGLLPVTPDLNTAWAPYGGSTTGIDAIPEIGGSNWNTIPYGGFGNDQDCFNPAHGNNWGVQWTGYINIPLDGLYWFGTDCDDAGMIYISGQAANTNNNWQGTGTYQLDDQNRVKKLALNAGLHTISVQFYEGGGGWGIRSLYLGPGITGTPFYTNGIGAWYDMPASAFWTNHMPAPAISATNHNIAPCTVTMTTALQGATIIYTTDGTTPTSNPLNGTTYTVPLDLSAWTMLNAIATSGGTDSLLATQEILSPLPVPWTDMTMGNPAYEGYAGYRPSTGAFVQTGYGLRWWDDWDQGNFCYVKLNGDCTIIARYVGTDNPGDWTGGTVMIRQSLDPRSVRVFMLDSTNNGTLPGDREGYGWGSNWKGTQDRPAIPCFIHIIKTGNDFTMGYSTDGVNWTNNGSATVTMTDPVYVGLGANHFWDWSQANGRYGTVRSTVTYDNVTVIGAVLLPEPVISATNSGNVPSTVTITDAMDGVTIYWTTDNSTPDPGQIDGPTTGHGTGTVTVTPAPLTAPTMVKAIAVLGGYANSPVVERFIPTYLPPPWVDQDIGGPPIAGSASYDPNLNGGTFTVTGSGADFGTNGGVSDQFNFCYMPINGNCQITARLVSMTDPGGGGNAQVGVMLRQDTSPGSEFALTFGTPPGHNIRKGTKRRVWPNQGNNNDAFNSGSDSYPYWLRIRRLGDNVYNLISADGVNWTQIRNDGLGTLWGQVIVGMALCSQNAAVPVTATFDNVKVESLVSTPVITGTNNNLIPSTVTITCATPGATIYYTTDQTIPNPPATGTLYTGTFVVNTPFTWVNAVATVPGYATSDVGWAFFDGLRTPEYPVDPGPALQHGVVRKYWQNNPWGGGCAPAYDVATLGQPASISGAPPIQIDPDCHIQGTWEGPGQNSWWDGDSFETAYYPYQTATFYNHNNWTVQYTGYLTVPQDGWFQLWLDSDDDAQIWMGGREVRRWYGFEGDHNVGLKAGTHKFEIRYAEGGGGYGHRFKCTGPGFVNTNIDGQDWMVSNAVLWTEAAPMIASILPQGGPAAGGGVVIQGTGFLPGAIVNFGGTPTAPLAGVPAVNNISGGTLAQGVTVNSNTTITCLAPPGTALSSVNVFVINRYDSTNNAINLSFNSTPGVYTYGNWNPAVTIFNVGDPTENDPPYGNAGDPVTVWGSGYNASITTTTTTLTNASADWTVAVLNNVVTVDTITAHGLPPSGANLSTGGAWTVNTFMAGLTNKAVTVVDSHTFTFALTHVDQVATVETDVTATVSWPVTVVHTPAVYFGSNPATNVALVSDSKITCTTPTGIAGLFNVAVVVFDGLGNSAQGLKLNAFTFYAVPTINANGIVPTHGTALGGTTVTISGTNFATSGISVLFGANAAAVQTVTSTTITVTTPAMTGINPVVDVHVVNPPGDPAHTATVTGGFTYDLQPALTGLTTEPGVSYKYWNQDTWWQNWQYYTPVRAGLRPNCTIVNVAGTNPFEPMRQDNWGVRFVGYIDIPNDGVWTLRTNSDDNSQMYIDGQLVVAWHFGQQDSPRLALQHGKHLFDVDMNQGGGGYSLNVSFMNETYNAGAWIDVPDSSFFVDTMPTLTAITPHGANPLPGVGLTSGNQSVTLSGSNYRGDPSTVHVYFGGTPGTVTAVDTLNGTITVTTPAGTIGLTDVYMFEPGLGSAIRVFNAFMYQDANSPTLTGMAPNRGDPAGGFYVTILGTNLHAGSTVTIDGNPVSGLSLINSTALAGFTPPGTLGWKDVVVTSPDLQTATLPLGYEYVVTGAQPDMTNGMNWEYFSNVGGTNGGVLPNQPAGGPDALDALWTPTAKGSIYPANSPYYTQYMLQFPTQSMTYGSTNAARVGTLGNNNDGGNLLSYISSQLQPQPNGPFQYFGDFYYKDTAFFAAPLDGQYTFETSSDDGSMLYIENTPVVLNNGSQDVTDRAGSINLTAGLHLMTILFGQGGGGWAISAKVQGPPGSGLNEAGLDWFPDNTLWIGAAKLRATHLSVTPSATSVVPGQPIDVTVKALDAAGNVDTNYVGTVRFSSTDPSLLTVLPGDTNHEYTFDSADQGVKTFTGGARLATVGSRTITGVDLSNAIVTGTSPAITVLLGPIDHLVVDSFPSPEFAGTAGSVRVTAKDWGNNTVASYTGTIHFTSSDINGLVVLPGDYTFVAGDLGTHTFTNGATLITSGTQSITATDTVTSTITGAQSGIIVNAGPAVSLRVSGYDNPVVAAAGSYFTVTALDSYNNIATGYIGTVHFTSSDHGVGIGLPDDYTFLPSDGGVKSALIGTLVTYGTQSITATDTVQPSITGTQSGIIVIPMLAVTAFGFPPTATAIAGVPGSVTVKAQDANGITATGYTGTIHFTSSDVAPQVVLPGNYTFVAGDLGTRTFTNGVTLVTSPTQSIAATDMANPAITGMQSNITVQGAAAATFAVNFLPNPTTVGVAGNVFVTAQDQYSNIAEGYVGTVHFTSSDLAAVLPGDTLLPGGSGTFSATLMTAGTQSITATDTVTSTITGTKSGIVVNKATPTITWANPADIVTGTPLGAAQLNAVASVPGVLTYTPAAGTVLPVGAGQTLHVDFVPTDTANYNNASKDVTINVLKITPVITWSNPADIVYGTPLGATQLNANASVPGTLTYTPAAATVLNAGNGQTLHVDFVPTDTVNYNDASKDVLINVLMATPVITWANPADILVGTALDATQLNATANVPGTMTYTPPSGTVLPVGPGQTLHVDFAPTDTANYNNAAKNVTINVIGGSLTILTRETQDTNGDGYIDAIRVTTSAPLNDNFAGLSITVAGYTVAGYDTGVGGANDNIFFVRLTPGATPDTDALPAVQVLDGGGLGLPVDPAAVAPVDKAKPVLMSAQWFDGSGAGVDANDPIYLTFSEPVTSNNALAADFGLPVTGDTYGVGATVSNGQNGTNPKVVTITLLGDPLLTPGGLYGPGALTPGSPSGTFVADGTRVVDGAGNTALVQTIGTAVDIQPGTESISICWDDLTVAPKYWNLGIVGLNATYQAYAAFPPNGLIAHNNGNVREKFTASVSVASPSGWAAATAAGQDQFELKVDNGVAPYGNYTLDLATGPKDLVGQLYSGHNKGFDLQLKTPTAITTGAGVAQTITVTITAVKD